MLSLNIERSSTLYERFDPLTVKFLAYLCNLAIEEKENMQIYAQDALVSLTPLYTFFDLNNRL